MRLGERLGADLLGAIRDVRKVGQNPVVKVDALGRAKVRGGVLVFAEDAARLAAELVALGAVRVEAERGGRL